MIVNYIFQAIEDELKISSYLALIMSKLKKISGLDVSIQGDEDMTEISITFEELLFLRIACEYTKSCKKQHSPDFLEALHNIMPDYEEYN